jgi:predicted nucleotidyltransferase
MNFQELSVQPITYNPTLNPELWDNNKLIPEVRRKLTQIAEHFVDFLKTPLDIQDITISGSNAGYNYSQYSDIDLHIVANFDESQTELFMAKKNNYNFTHDIKIHGIDVELYVQQAKDTHFSVGIYSVMRNKWISEPKHNPPKVRPEEIKSKARNYSGQINQALRSDNLQKAQETMEEIYRLRKAGLESGGEDSVENLAFKLLRARGQIDKLRKYINKLQSAELSLGEQNED